jgi:tetratricopeptide (TPR) repeat protein
MSLACWRGILIRSKFVCLAAAILCVGAAFAKGEGPSPDFVEDKDGENALALEDYARSESIYRKDLTTKPAAAQESYYHTCLGEALLWQGRFSEAGKEFKKAFGLMEKTQPAASDLRARVLDDLAWWKETQNDRAAATTYCLQAIQALKTKPQADPIYLCELLEHGGALAQDSGRYREAADCYNQALEWKQKKFGPQSMQAADDEEKLAAVMRLLGDAGQADRMYREALQVKWNSPALFAKYSPHSYYDDVIYRFYTGAPNCAVGNRQGITEESINMRGVTVSASVSNPTTKELTKTCCVNVSVMNDTPNAVQLLPKPPILIVLAPNVVISHMIDPTTLANQVQKKGEKSAKWVRFWGADSTMPVTTTFIGRPGVWGYPPITSYNGVAPIVNTSGNVTTVTTQVPDYAASMRALQKAAAIEDRTRQQASAIRNSILATTTVAPGGNISGALYFDSGNVQKAVVQIPVGNAIFEFKFPPQN